MGRLLTKKERLLNQLSYKELLQLADAKGYKVPSSWKKHELVENFVKHQWPEKILYVSGTVEERTDTAIEEIMRLIENDL